MWAAYTTRARAHVCVCACARVKSRQLIVLSYRIYAYVCRHETGDTSPRTGNTLVRGGGEGVRREHASAAMRPALACHAQDRRYTEARPEPVGNVSSATPLATLRFPAVWRRLGGEQKTTRRWTFIHFLYFFRNRLSTVNS